MNKKVIRVSDAIPDVPASFDRTVENTLKEVCAEKKTAKVLKEQSNRKWTSEGSSARKRSGRISRIAAYSAVALLLVAVFAIGAVIAKNALSDQTKTPSQLAQEETGAPQKQDPETNESQDNLQTVYAATVDEFLAAIAPNTKVVLTGKNYNLSTASDYGIGAGTYYAWNEVEDSNNETEGYELVIRDLENFHLVGSENAVIEAEPRYAAVIHAENCTGLRFYDFTAGHTIEPEICSAVVIELGNCTDTRIDTCRLYGCGTNGVRADECEKLEIINSDIYECSNGGIVLHYSQNVRVIECTLRDCGYRDYPDTPEYDARATAMIDMWRSCNVTIQNCDIYGNNTLDVFVILESVEITVTGTRVRNNSISGNMFGFAVPDSDVPSFIDPDHTWIRIAGCEFQTIEKRLLDPADEYDVFDLNGNKLTEKDLREMKLDRTVDAKDDTQVTESEPTPELQADPESNALCLFFDGCLNYEPYENWVWSNQDDGLAADGMSFVYKMDEIQDKIPTIHNPAELTITAGDGVHLEPQLSIYDAELNFVAHDAEISVRTLEPGTYYVSQRVSRRETDRTSGYECIVRLVIGDSDPTSEATPEPVGDDPGKVLWNDPTAFPGTFRFWDYDMENGFREAPAEGVLFVCDFDGDGKEEEIRYEYHGSFLTISVGKKSVELCYGAGLEQAILLDLDPASARLNLLVVYNTGSEDYETAELHMENGRFVLGPVIFAYCTYDGETLLGSATQTYMLGTKWGERTYHGEDLTPDSEWYDCDVIPDDIPTARDRESLIEGGVLLHLVRDLPCTVDGADAVIPAGTYIYMTRWHESWTLAEIRTEDGTLTALVTVQRADPDDPEQYGYLIDGEMQDTYFDNIFYCD